MPGCVVKKCSTRGWSVRLTCPADWATRVLGAGLALYQRRRPRGIPAVPGIVLYYSDGPAGRLLTVLERPHPNHNDWRVYTVTVTAPC